ncbi:MAG: tautomerase family protein [Candidatus Omnitrophica bacterium]|nr:tautomerase family protein [Candidatus Omnitrophota bacterium]
MPLAKVEGPPISVDTKRALVKEITDALEKAYKFPRAVYGVIIKENLPENVGSGGELVVDKKKKAPGA